MEVKGQEKEGAEARKRRSSCAEEEVCVNSMVSRIKNLKKLLIRLASLEMNP